MDTINYEKSQNESSYFELQKTLLLIFQLSNTEVDYIRMQEKIEGSGYLEKFINQRINDKSTKKLKLKI